MARLRPALATALLALAAAGCGAREDDASRGDGDPAAASRSAAARSLARDAPPTLRGVYAQGGELLPGGVSAFRARLRELRGYPVVVNKWASWCGPCRSELPYFSRQARVRGKRMAFLGSNTNDTASAARRFLAEIPLPFPSYEDQNGDIAQAFNGAIAFPATAFYDRRGRLATVKQGVYASERELVADIERYAR